MTTQVKEPPAALAIAAEAPAAPVTHVARLRETRKFTVAEYYRMVEVGILQTEERVELIEGDILVRPPSDPCHAEGVDDALEVFSPYAVSQFRLRVQAPVRLGERLELEPDLALLRRRPGGYGRAHPTAADVLLAIEVADSTLAYDRDIKSHIYGRAGVPETWVLNLPGDCLEVFRNPGREGYAQHTIYRRGDKIRPVALPDLEFAVADLLPTPPAPERVS